MGHLIKALKLLKGYLEDMIKSSDYLEQIETELKSEELSTGFKTSLFLTLQRRCKILKISQVWILEQYQQTLG